LPASKKSFVQVIRIRPAHILNMFQHSLDARCQLILQ